MIRSGEPSALVRVGLMQQIVCLIESWKRFCSALLSLSSCSWFNIQLCTNCLDLHLTSLFICCAHTSNFAAVEAGDRRFFDVCLCFSGFFVICSFIHAQWKVKAADSPLGLGSCVCRLLLLRAFHLLLHSKT